MTWTDGRLPRTGARVVVRYRLPAGSSHPMTDVIGVLESVDPRLCVRTAAGHEVAVDLDSVVAVRELGPAPVRTRDIRALEHAAALAWPGTEHEWIGGWLARAGGPERPFANSAVPLADAPLRGAGALADLTAPETFARLRRWYRDRDRPLRLTLPDRLVSVPEFAVTDGESTLLTRTLPAGAPGPPDAENAVGAVTQRPDARWLRAHREFPAGQPAGVDELTSAVGELGFGQITDEDSEPVAIGRVAVTATPAGERYGNVAELAVRPDLRGRGLARSLVDMMSAWAHERGARNCFTVVRLDDRRTLDVAHALGFTDHHGLRFGTVHGEPESASPPELNAG